MAVVPFSVVPTVAPDARPPSDYQTEQASPASFGSIGAQELEQSGQNLKQAGAQGLDAAVSLQQRYNQIGAQDAYNKLQRAYIDATYYHNPDNPSQPGIYGLKGQDAMKAAPTTLTYLEKTRQDILDGMPNAAMRLAFEESSRRLQYNTQADIGRHVDAQTSVWGLDTAKSQGDLARQNAGLYYNDPDKLNEQAVAARNAAMSGVKVSLGQGIGPSDPNIQDAMNKADSGVVINAVLARAATDPVGARNMLNTWTLPGHLPNEPPIKFSDAVGEAKPQLLEQINARADQVEGGLAGTAAFNNTVGSSAPGAGPRGLRNNNPLNLEFKPGQGASGSDGRFGTYPTMEAGVAANAKQLISYQDDHGLNTVSGIVGRWSPSNDPGNAPGSTAAYAASVARAMGVGLNDQLNLHNPVTLSHMISAMASVENGRPLDPQVISRGVGNVIDGTPLPTAPANVIPTTNNSRPPLTGDQILSGEAAIDNDPRALTPQWRAAAHADFQRHLATYNLAQATDGKNALNDLGPKIALNPTSVSPQDIWNDGRLTYPEKVELSRQLTQEQSGKGEGDGAQFKTVFERTNLPVGDPQRINSDRDLIPYVGSGAITFQGLNKMRSWMTDRDKPEAAIQKAALHSWQMQIEGTPGGTVSPGPVSSAKWAQFLGWALPEIEKEKGSKTMAQIVSPTGDIAKNVSHYFLTGDEISQNLLGQLGTQGAPTDSNAPAPAAQPSGPPRPIAGSWYKGTQPVMPGTPGARYYNGGALNDPASWPAAAPGPVPTAPTTEGGAGARGADGEPGPPGAEGDMPARGYLPGTLHLDPTIAPQVPVGAPRPFAPGEYVRNPNGGWSSEISVTVTNPDINGGKATVLPSLWIVNGRAYRAKDEDEAVKFAVRSHLPFRSFDNIEAAEKFANDRESEWQRVNQGDPSSARTIPSLWAK